LFLIGLAVGTGVVLVRFALRRLFFGARDSVTPPVV
jgi:hypothetical protein